MAPQQDKRKDAPTGASGRQGKRKKHGNEGRWRTPHQQAKSERAKEGSVVAGDVGIWVTCARNQEWKAVRETTMLFEEYADIMYGLSADGDSEEGGGGGDDGGDIAAAVQRELESLKAGGGKGGSRLFTPVKLDTACLLFFRTPPPVDPVALARRICEDARACSDPRKMKSRYVNRLIPAVLVGKATEQGLAEVSRMALSPFFELSGTGGGDAVVSEDGSGSGSGSGERGEARDEPARQPREQARTEASRPYSFAIRPNIRSNSALKRDVVINQIAASINGGRHKVNLEKPDKVILVDVYMNVCSMSVVDGDWDDLKKYNLSELYNLASK